MADLDSALFSAWSRIYPRLKSHPAELARRLARRRSSLLQRPPRAWCLALRASDTRLNPFISPSPHPSSSSFILPPSSFLPSPHPLTITAPLLRQLCRPVQIPSPGLDWQDVAALLGVHEESLRRSMYDGTFNVHHVPRLGGKPGKPVPILYSPKTFDPSSSNLKRPPDPIWGSLWKHLADRIPDDLEFTVTRVPRLSPYTHRPGPRPQIPDSSPVSASRTRRA